MDTAFDMNTAPIGYPAWLDLNMIRTHRTQLSGPADLFAGRRRTYGGCGARFRPDSDITDEWLRHV